MKQYVIIGGGVASVGCIEGIRAYDKDARITLIAGEKRPVYCRPLISYYLEGKTDFERMKYRPDSFYEDNQCTLIFDTATKILPEQHTVFLENGESVQYDALCYATGSAPFVPRFEGLETVPQKFSFMTEDDALALEQAIRSDSRVFIIGAGLIGLKCAEGIAERVQSITVCDLAPRVLSSILDDTCAAVMQKKLEEHGVSFLLGDSVKQFEQTTAYMNSGKSVSFDILILAVGVRPNTAMIRDCGGNVDRGVLIDTNMKTSLPDIYAAGDCTQGYDASIGANRILAILPNAYMQGYCAGCNIAGHTSTFDNAIPMNAIGFFGLHALTAGSYDGEMYEEKDEHSIRRLFTRDGYLIGFIMIGCADNVGILTSLIRSKTPLSDVDFAVLKKHPSLASFSSEYRRQKLGGVV